MLIVERDRTLARYGRDDGQVVALCASCERTVEILASRIVAGARCPHCGSGEASPVFTMPPVSPDFRRACARRLRTRFAQAMKTSGVERPREQPLLKWLGYTDFELAQHISEAIARGCFYCQREIVGFFHVCHVEPIAAVTAPIELWQTFQLHNVVAAHAECNHRNRTRGRDGKPPP